MAAAGNALGLCLILAALHDIFRTLFHPAGRGALSDWVARFVWNIFRTVSSRNPRSIILAGPFGILAIMGIWVVLIVIGFSLIYLPYIGSFALAPGLDPARHHSFLDAVNVSLGSLITVGGDFNSKSRVLRLAMGVEATLGFGLLTASVSWLLSIYPALERRRTFAHQMTLLHSAETESGFSVVELPSQEAQQIVWGLVAEMSSLRNDLTQFPITYYFHSGESHTGLGGVLTYVAEMADVASRPEVAPGLRIAATALGGAMDDFLEYIAGTFLLMPMDDKAAILRKYAEEQMREPIHWEGTRTQRRVA
jgi:hypothetical protein